MRLTALVFLLAASNVVQSDFADFGTVPKGVNPSLYDPSDDAIVQLDETTFNDTVFCNGREDCSSYVVEFYSDWCGHCRSYASLYKSFAKDIRGWSKIVKIAAMNCADPLNEATCRANGIMFFPYIKYFPRNSSDTFYGVKLRPYQSVSEMRDQITQILIQDYAINRFPDWPVFDVLGDISTYGELWQGAKESADTMAIVFESDPNSMIGAQLLLDLTKFSDRLLARRCLKGHPLVDALHINDFPTLAVFRRGERTPVMVAELRRLLLHELEEFMTNENPDKDVVYSSRKNKTTNICAENPEKCRALFFVSETDMLKAMRYALLREVARNGGYLTGANLTALYSFVDTLAQTFPITTFDSSLGNDTEVFLPNSSRARIVFTHMRDFLDAHGLDEPLSVDDWQSEFVRAEEDQGNPFPISADWDHCKGTSPEFRGYTCGLWTTFHALTVASFKKSGEDVSYRPLPVLQSVRDWVGSFFGCEHCRKHFLKMTTRTFKMEANVRKSEDVFLYLWRAHNIVNARLKGRDTEDPRFPKYQFPALFLCPQCHSNKGRMNEQEVHRYLIDYYSRIKPVRV
uniref:Sulfhydryl oxidase n=1 Tax=Panagrolaimus sp. JU765 TaxID=591449 RepID=A0AC34QV21_9BILA